MKKGPPSATAVRILDVAQRLTQTRGFNAFSYADISRELRIRNASIHYHFPSKAALGRGLVARYRETFVAGLGGILERAPRAPDQLRLYVGIWSGVLRQGDRMCLCGMMASDIATLPRAVREEVRRFFDENEAWLARVLAAGRDARELRLSAAPETEARLLVMGLEGAMLVARSYGEPARFDEIAARLLEVVGVKA